MSAPGSAETPKGAFRGRITPHELSIIEKVRNAGMKEPGRILLPAKIFELQDRMKEELAAGRTFREALENVMLRSSWRHRNVTDAKLPYYAEVAHELFNEPYDAADGWFDANIMEVLMHAEDERKLDAFNDPHIEE